MKVVTTTGEVYHHRGKWRTRCNLYFHLGFGWRELAEAAAIEAGMRLCVRCAKKETT